MGTESKSTSCCLGRIFLNIINDLVHWSELKLIIEIHSLHSWWNIVNKVLVILLVFPIFPRLKEYHNSEAGTYTTLQFY